MDKKTMLVYALALGGIGHSTMKMLEPTVLVHADEVCCNGSSNCNGTCEGCVLGSKCASDSTKMICKTRSPCP